MIHRATLRAIDWLVTTKRIRTLLLVGVRMRRAFAGLIFQQTPTSFPPLVAGTFRRSAMGCFIYYLGVYWDRSNGYLTKGACIYEKGAY